jgi:predicted nucleic acid-binding protein
MDIVVDANILIAALIKDGYTRRLLVFSDDDFSVPEYLFDEVADHLAELEGKSRLPKERIRAVLGEILHLANVRVVPIRELTSHLEAARRIAPDKDDSLYFALALKKNCPIWSNDRRLKSQKEVVVFTTAEMAARRSV